MTKKTIFLLLIPVAILFIGIFYWYRSANQPSAPRTVKAALATVTQDVDFTGRLHTKNSVNLGFEYPGTIAKILVSEGDKVSAGDILAQLDTAAANLEIARARADRQSATEQTYLAWHNSQTEINLVQRTNNASLDTKRQAVRDAKTELDQAKFYHQQVQQEQGEDNSTVLNALAAVRLKETAYHAAQQTLTNTETSAAKSNAAAEHAASAAKAAHFAAVQASGSDPGLSALKATENLAHLKLSKQSIKAPFAGTITAVNYQAGEIPPLGQTVISLATTADLELIADVTESDALKLSPNMPAAVAFDALPTDDHLSAIVDTISPTAKLAEGVPTYKITLLLTSPPARPLPPGLTANITVNAGTKENVLAVPRRAVIIRGPDQLVRVLQNNTILEKKVTLGLIGNDGLVEITSGLSIDEDVIIEPAGS
jgi:HlyD family secretion protein